MFVLLLIISLYFYGLALTAESRAAALRGYCLSSLSMGIATLVKPIAQYIPLLLVAFLFMHIARKRDALKYSMLCLFVFGLTLSPWCVRNYLAFGHFSLSTSGSYNLLVLNVVPLEMAERNQDALTVTRALLFEADQMIVSDGMRPRELNEFQRAKYWQRLAFRYIKGNPIGFGRVYALGILRTFANMGTFVYARALDLPMERFDMRSFTSVADLIRGFVRKKGTAGLAIAGAIAPYLLVSYLGMAVGLVTCWRRYDGDSLLFSLCLAIYFIAIAGAGGLGRFKLPSLPFYLPFVGIGLNHFYEGVRHGRVSRGRT